MNTRFIAITMAVLLSAASYACADSRLEVGEESQDAEPASPGPDGGTSLDDAYSDATWDTADALSEQCCSPGDVECPDTDRYRICVSPGGDCGQWQSMESCPSGQICDPSSGGDPPCEPICSSDHPDYGDSCTVGTGVCKQFGNLTCVEDDSLGCDATAGEPQPQQCDGRDNNCDGTVDSDGICGPCEDDQYAPDNFVSETAVFLDAGSTLDDLVLCDNEESEVTSHNFFYLGYISQFEVHLAWEEVHGPLGLDFWTANTSTATWEDRQYLADGGQHPSELTHGQSLASATHVYARVFFRLDPADKPPAGTPYSISHD